MTNQLHANASPEKRLFISLITKDISIKAAFLDLIDNSINSVVEKFTDRLKTAEDYEAVLNDPTFTPTATIQINFFDDEIKIVDNASGISTTTAEEHVFKFGRGSNESHANDRLSVYGIGLKRALFKLGNLIEINSNHIDGGFRLSLDVDKWAHLQQERWEFDITATDATEKTGTEISIKGIHPDVKNRIHDGVFLGQLEEAISQTYAFYLEKFVDIYVNDKKIEGLSIEMGSNHASMSFTEDQVSCTISAGLAINATGSYKDKAAGWYVFCNGRSVISADKSFLTGWGLGGNTGLPIFQPKHRPFLGFVFFVSEYPEKLPWNTTKSYIDEDSLLWQITKRNMINCGKQITKFLDKRYKADGTDVKTSDLKDFAGASNVGAIAAANMETQSFVVPKTPKPKKIKIQYHVPAEKYYEIEKRLGRSSVPPVEVGELTFDYYFKNEIGEN